MSKQKKTHRFSEGDLVIVNLNFARDITVNSLTGGIIAPGPNWRSLYETFVDYQQGLVVRPYGRMIQSTSSSVPVLNISTRWRYVDDYIVVLAGEQAGRRIAIMDSGIMTLEEYERDQFNKQSHRDLLRKMLISV